MSYILKVFNLINVFNKLFQAQFSSTLGKCQNLSTLFLKPKNEKNTSIDGYSHVNPYDF